MKKLVSVLEYILALFIILNCRSVYQHSIGIDFRINEILVLVIAILILIKIITKQYDKSKLSTSLVYLFFYALFITIFALLNDVSGQIKGFLINFVIILPSLFFYYFIDKDSKKAILSVLSKISNIMVILSVISLVLFLIGPILKIVKTTGTISVSWADKQLPSYFGLQFVTQHTNFFGTKLLRNTGIFVEAPMYSLNLTIALAIQLFIIEDKKSLLKKFILLITILTTISTTGIIITIVMILIKGIMLIKEKFFDKNINIAKTVTYLISPILIIISLVVIIKVVNDKKQSESWLIRLDDYKACFEAWKDNILFGNGYGNEESIEKYMSAFREEGLSNSIMVLLAQCGIYLFILYFIPIYRMIVYGIKIKNIKISIFVMILLILFITTIFTYTAMIINFLAIGYALSTNREKYLLIESKRKD